jgi:hypothetical protein
MKPKKCPFCKSVVSKVKRGKYIFWKIHHSKRCYLVDQWDGIRDHYIDTTDGDEEIELWNERT